MRLLCALILVWGTLAPGMARAGELGAFFAFKSLAAYEGGPRQGARINLRANTAYAVVGLAWDSSERLWLRVRVPELQRTVRGEGWTPLTAQELAARGAALVDVYARPVEPGRSAGSVTPVPAAGVQLHGAGEASKFFAQVVWRPVRYSARQPAQPWVQAATGVYRPGRSPAFLMGVQQELAGAKVPPEAQPRLLAGVVRAGDTAQEARWAWGEPLRTWKEGPEARRVTVWGYGEGQLRFDGAAVKEVR